MKPKTMKKHEEQYIHIKKPTWKEFGKFTSILLTTFLSIVNFFLIKTIYIKENLGYIFANKEELINYSPKFFDLMILYPILAEYILISLTIILIVSCFKKLNKYDEEGLIFGLIGGLIGGLIAGLIAGLTGGLIVGLIVGLIGGLIVGLTGELN